MISLSSWLGLKQSTGGKNMQTGTGVHLILDRMLGNVTVVFDQDSNQFSMEVAGDEEYASQAQLTSKGSTVSISCPIPVLGRAPWGISGSGKINGRLIVDGYYVDESKAIDVLVHAPHNISVTTRGLFGTLHCKNTLESLHIVNESMCEVTVGDVGGNLHIENDTTQTVTVGVVQGYLVLKNKSAGKIQITQAKGTVEAHISGTGDVTLKNGTVPQLKVNTNSPGKFDFLGEAKEIEITSAGTGDVTIKKALGGNITCIMESSGKVKVSEGFCQNVSLHITGTGDFHLGGKVNGNIESMQSSPGKAFIADGVCDFVNLEVTGTGDFKFNGTVTGEVRAMLTAPGDATIKGGNCKYVHAIVTGTGDFQYSGHTKDAYLRTSGPGDIRVESVTNFPDQARTGTGRINIG